MHNLTFMDRVNALPNYMGVEERLEIIKTEILNEIADCQPRSESVATKAYELVRCGYTADEAVTMATSSEDNAKWLRSVAHNQYLGEYRYWLANRVSYCGGVPNTPRWTEVGGHFSHWGWSRPRTI